MTKLYAKRDLYALDKVGGHYCKHVMAMTSEALHSKSDIAAELAYRDALNAELLEALVETLDEGIGWFVESGDWGSERLDWVIKARAAIAKATGETK
ncbi:MAG: hypothetical protein KGI54_10515 [Pseudomonadota bacterium]|nr:hypothetical protein [Pseudomonadota bacterium]